MKKTTFLFLLLIVISKTTPSFAYNFLQLDPNSGAPVGWGSNSTITYYLDPGDWIDLTNAQAHTLVKEAMKLWEATNPAAPRFIFGGYLDQDVNESNYPQYVSRFACNASDLENCEAESQRNFQTVVIFDESGDILDAFCPIVACVAQAGARVYSDASQGPQAILQGQVVLGRLVTTGPGGINKRVGTITHELGHLLGLAHTSVNQQVFLESVENDLREIVPTMADGLFGASGAEFATTLNPDDVTGMNALYSSTVVEQETANIEGKILKSDNSSMPHVNVVARNVEDPLCKTYSFLSGRICQFSSNAEFCDEPIDDNSEYTLIGLPPGTYTLEVEEIADEDLAFTYAPGLFEPFIHGDAEFWNENDAANESNTLFTEITLAAGETRQDIDIILNRSEVTDDRIKFLPLDTFTAGPGTDCPEEPPVNYAELIGIDEGGEEPPPTSGGSGGCSLAR